MNQYLRTFVAVVILWVTAMIAPTTASIANDLLSAPLPKLEHLLYQRARFENGVVQLAPDAERCEAQSSSGMRQRIVEIALRAWTAFGQASLDLSAAPRAVPSFPRPEAPRPTSDDGPRRLAMIAGFWAVARFGFAHIDQQNRRWILSSQDLWRDHWSAAFTSWVMCEAGLDKAQFLRSVVHRGYIQHALSDERSAFSFMPTNAQPFPGDLICAAEDRRPTGAFGPDKLDNLAGRLHCYVVISNGRATTIVIGGNVIDWSKAPSEEYGSVGLLVIEKASIAARGSSTSCADNKPCWLLGLRLKDNQTVSYADIPLTLEARTLLNGEESQP